MCQQEHKEKVNQPASCLKQKAADPLPLSRRFSSNSSPLKEVRNNIAGSVIRYPNLRDFLPSGPQQHPHYHRPQSLVPDSIQPPVSCQGSGHRSSAAHQLFKTPQGEQRLTSRRREMGHRGCWWEAVGGLILAPRPDLSGDIGLASPCPQPCGHSNELVAHCVRCFASLSMAASGDVTLRAAKGLCSHALADYADDERSIR